MLYDEFLFLVLVFFLSTNPLHSSNVDITRFSVIGAVIPESVVCPQHAKPSIVTGVPHIPETLDDVVKIISVSSGFSVLCKFSCSLYKTLLQLQC